MFLPFKMRKKRISLKIKKKTRIKIQPFDIQSMPARRPYIPRFELSHFSNACIYNSTWKCRNNIWMCVTHAIFSIVANSYSFSYFEYVLNGSEKWSVRLFDSMNLKYEFFAQNNASDDIVSVSFRKNAIKLINFNWFFWVSTLSCMRKMRRENWPVHKISQTQFRMTRWHLP